MTTKENKQCIDLICKQVQENDVITKEGQRTTFLSVYKGSMNVLMGTDDEGEPVESLITFELKLKSDNKTALEECVPLLVGAKRKMELSLTNEDLDNHDME